MVVFIYLLYTCLFGLLYIIKIVGLGESKVGEQEVLTTAGEFEGVLQLSTFLPEPALCCFKYILQEAFCINLRWKELHK